MLEKILQQLKDSALIISIIVGLIFHKWLGPFNVTVPYMIFIMLFITFCKISPKDLKITRLHIALFSIQFIGCFACYIIFKYLSHSEDVAQSIFICILMPSATSSAVVTGLLGGNVAFLTSYLLLANIGTSLLGPLFFSFINPEHISFWTSVGSISLKIMPVLLTPLLLAWILQWVWPKGHEYVKSKSKLSFYLWAISLTIIIGTTFNKLLQSNENIWLEISLTLIALAVCLTQFGVGKLVGKHYGELIAGGQALGQKNTILGIWLAQSYLVPSTSIALIAYIIWQNIVNSLQITLKTHRDRKLKKQE